MEENKKNNKIVLVIIVLLLLIGVGVGCFFLGQNLTSNDSSKEESNKTTDETTTTILKEKTSNFSIDELRYFNIFSYFMPDANDEELYKSDKVYASDLSSKYKNRLAFAYYRSDIYSKGGKYDNLYDGKEYNEEYAEEVNYLKSSTLEKYYKELFGKNANYEKVDFNTYSIGSIGLNYNQAKDLYYVANEAGDYSNFRYATEFYKLVEKDKTLELYSYVVVYHHNFENDKRGVYKNINEARSFINPIKESIGDYSTYKQYDGVSIFGQSGDDLRDYKDKASQYKIIMEKEDHHYIFKSIEKIK